ncbi:hypothetical protein GCM10023086_24280 [Streptomyces venetus]|uniref:Uncharacterized protein n=1 Tax=Streptomyces venetus TaxID=1701086 RepID=A0ABP8FLA1_9ACTN
MLLWSLRPGREAREDIEEGEEKGRADYLGLTPVDRHSASGIPVGSRQRAWLHRG